MINSESKIKLQENHWNSYEAIFLQERTDFYDYKKNKKIILSISTGNIL